MVYLMNSPSTTRSTPTHAPGSDPCAPLDTCAAESSKAMCGTSTPRTSPRPAASTPSPASGHGSTRSSSRAGQTGFQFGPEAAPASPSASPDASAEQPTRGTSGQLGSASSASAALRSSLESKLRALLDSRGSTLYRLTWKERVTPSGRRICALRASVPRISANACSSWPTPQAFDGAHGGTDKRSLSGGRSNLVDRALVVLGWVSPVSNDANGSTYAYSRGNHSKIALKLPGQALLASWATPACRNWRNGLASPETMERNARPLNEQAVQFVASGATPNGSTASTGKRGQLNPAHSRWLMGLPVEWLWCAPENKPVARFKIRTGTTGAGRSSASGTPSSRNSRPSSRRPR